MQFITDAGQNNFYDVTCTFGRIISDAVKHQHKNYTF